MHVKRNSLCRHSIRLRLKFAVSKLALKSASSNSPRILVSASFSNTSRMSEESDDDYRKPISGCLKIPNGVSGTIGSALPTTLKRRKTK